MNAFLRATACAMVLTLLAAGGALATHGKADQAVPISGWTFGTDTVTVPSARCQAGEALYEHSGTGYVAHLGAVDVVVTHCSRFTSPTGGTAGPGTMTMTAADGDRLFFTESATFELSMGPSGPVNNIDLVWQVTGGTGRFAHATGSGSGSGLSLLALGTTSMTYRGTIVYDASDRADD